MSKWWPKIKWEGQRSLTEGVFRANKIDWAATVLFGQSWRKLSVETSLDRQEITNEVANVGHTTPGREENEVGLFF